jgi:pyruvate kinase
VDYIASSVNSIVSHSDTVAAILAPTDSGLTARRLSRYKLPTWILAVSSNKKTCREMLFSYGVFPVYEINHPTDWTDFARDYALKFRLKGSCIIQTEGPSPESPDRNHKMEIIDLREIATSTSSNGPLPTNFFISRAKQRSRCHSMIITWRWP